MGDRVYLKLQPYVQSSLAPRSSQKLSFKYFGPYTVEERIGSLAYRLALPPSAHIHPVFHVSLLKQAIGNQVVSSSLPSVPASMAVPEHILQCRVSAGERRCCRVSSSGLVFHLHWQLGKTWRRCVNASRWLRLGDKSLLKGRRVLLALVVLHWFQIQPPQGPSDRRSPILVFLAQNGRCKGCIR